jgi:hypothetical protein
MDLGFEEDILAAFEGILSRLRPYLRCGYVFGLPAMDLENALAWRSGTVDSDWTSEGDPSKMPNQKKAWDSLKPCDLLRRRKKRITKEKDNPSWSWASWIGEIDYNYNTWLIIDWYVKWVAEDDSFCPLFEGCTFSAASRGFRLGIDDSDGKWIWAYERYNPGYCIHTNEPTMRFARPIEPGA